MGTSEVDKEGQPQGAKATQEGGEDAVRSISADTCRMALDHLRLRAELCVTRNGRHVENVLQFLEQTSGLA